MLQISLNTAIEPYGVSLLDDEKLLSSYLWSYSDTGKNDHIIGIDFILKNSNKKIIWFRFFNYSFRPRFIHRIKNRFYFCKNNKLYL